MSLSSVSTSLALGGLFWTRLWMNLMQQAPAPRPGTAATGARPSSLAALSARSVLPHLLVSGPSSGGHQSATGSICDVVMKDSESKFWKMWGNEAWQKTHPRQRKCWGKSTEMDDFFSDVLAGKQCDINWFEGADKGALGLQASRPTFTSPAPALFGFDQTIFEYCSEKLGMQRYFDGHGDFNEELAHRCVAANQNILRRLSPRMPWNMCQNLRWTVCAVNGLLPGQDQHNIHFATPLSELSVETWEHPDSWPCEDGECPEDKFAVGDVFYAEVCMLNRMCENGDDVFSLAMGDEVTCRFSPQRFQELALSLRWSLSLSNEACEACVCECSDEKRTKKEKKEIENTK